MDPYLEARWGDVHQRLITYAADQLGSQLPPDLRARVEERVFVEDEPVTEGYVEIRESGGGKIVTVIEFLIYALPWRERLPVIRVPLRQHDHPVRLDLRALIDQCYQNGRHDDIDYTQAPVPPLAPEDAAWAEDLLKAAGKR